MTRRILAFAEDTGAANYLACMPKIAKDLGLECKVFGSAYGARQFGRLNVEHLEVTPGSFPWKYLEDGRTSILAVGNGINLESLGLDLTRKAQSKGIVTLGIVDQRQNLGDRFRGPGTDPLAFQPDWIIVPDHLTGREFIQMGVNENRVVECGHPYFDALYSQRDFGENLAPCVRKTRFPNWTPGSKLVVFAAEPSISVRGSVGQYRKTSNYTMHGRGRSDYRTHIALEEFLDAVAAVPGQTFRVLRLHPHEPSDDEFSDYYSEFDAISRTGLPINLIQVADLLVSVSSMLLIEALLLGRPTLSIMPDPTQTSILPSIEAGLTPVAHDGKRLLALMTQLLEAPADATSQQALVETIFPRNGVGRLKQFIRSHI